MYRYSAKIRISGSVMNEVRRPNMSAAEIMILRQLHGNDAVVDISESEKADKKADHGKERERLKRRYLGQSERRTKLNFATMFGPEHLPLPERLPDFANKAAEVSKLAG